jgi:hypothetical protein
MQHFSPVRLLENMKSAWMNCRRNKNYLVEQCYQSNQLLPEQPIKEQNRSFECLLAAFHSSSGEGEVFADGGVVISNYYYWHCSLIKNQHVSFFILATTQTDVSLPVELSIELT